MTEAEWLACTDPTPMAEYLRGEFLGGKSTERKMRLFACSWTRTIGAPALAYSAIEAAERFVDGQGTRAEMAAARAALAAYDCSGHSGWEYYLAGWSAALSACIEDAQWALMIDPSPIAVLFATPADKVAMCAQLREVFGNPRRPVVVAASWLTWNDGAVRKIAQVVYQERASDQMPILADALEEAGCTDQAILGHCRGPGPHVRGCSVVDLLLGKE